MNPSWLAENPWVIWLTLAVVLIVVEMFSGGELFLLMFGVAAAVSAGESALGLAWWLTIMSFAIVSALLVYFVRPPIMARVHSGPTLPQGHQRVIGAQAVVTAEVTPYDGRILVAGDEWTARSAGEASLPVGTAVTVTRLEGVTAIVEPAT